MEVTCKQHPKHSSTDNQCALQMCRCCKCPCVHMCICADVQMCRCCKCPCVHMCICAYVHMCRCADVLMCICAYVQMCRCPNVHMSICAYAHMSRCPNVHMCMCACVHVCMSIWQTNSTTGTRLVHWFIQPWQECLTLTSGGED